MQVTNMCIHAQVELVGSAVLRLVAHREDYFVQLPNLLLENPLSTTACQPSITGVRTFRPDARDAHVCMPLRHVFALDCHSRRI